MTGEVPEMGHAPTKRPELDERLEEASQNNARLGDVLDRLQRLRDRLQGPVPVSDQEKDCHPLEGYNAQFAHLNEDAQNLLICISNTIEDIERYL